jgi:N-acetylglucosaminyl-diphospho-decaprenol L-rhamnosyltransferase
VRVFVVDNASGDGTAEMVRRDFPEVCLDAAPANLGFAAATNRAVLRGTGRYILALNPDTRLLPGTLDTLLELMEARPEVGICGCRLELENGSIDHAAKRSFPTPVSAVGHFTGVGRRAGASGRVAAYRAPDVERGRVDAVNGAFMLMRRAALEEVGLFDEGYWMYMEDLDLCYRFAESGWVTWYEPSAVAVHVKAGSSGPYRSARLNYAFHYGMFRFYRKHYAARSNVLLNGLVYVGIASKLVVSVSRNAVRRSIAQGRAGGHRRASRVRSA